MKLSKDKILQGLKRLGELAEDEGFDIELIAVGSTPILIELDSQRVTDDIDVILKRPDDWQRVLNLAIKISKELGMPIDWLNTAAKIFFKTPPAQPSKLLFSSKGIKVYRPPLEYLLLSKLTADRLDKSIQDMNDALILLRAILKDKAGSDRDTIRKTLLTYIGKQDQSVFERNFDIVWKTL